jgi:hypothetical protein
MSTPVILYNSAGIPIGPRAVVQFYRPPTTADANGYLVANVVPFGSETSGTAIGLPVVIEGLSINLSGSAVGQMGTYGEPLDNASLVRGTPTLTIESFIAAAGSPTLMPGDYISINIGMTATSTASSPVPIPASRWFIGSNGIATNGANKNSCQMILDRTNSDPNLKEF